MSGDDELRRQLRTAQKRSLEDRRQREAAEERALQFEERALEERRQREAEERERRLTLADYLHSYHTSDELPEVKAVGTSATRSRSHARNAAGRLCPRHIVPWKDFPNEISKVYDKLSMSKNFFHDRILPTLPPLQGLELVRCEVHLRQRQQAVVIDAVDVLLEKVCEDPRLRETFDIAAGGRVSFDDYEKMHPHVTLREKPKTDSTFNRYCQSCDYRASGVDENSRLVLLVLYESPCQLPPAQMAMGLDGENVIELGRSHVTNESHQTADSITLESRRLAAAVITQLFQAMIRRKVRFGYVDTGEVKLFLRIGEDPSRVEYFLAVPSRDVEVEGDAEPRLQLTSVAQVFAFTLLALQSPIPDKNWKDASQMLGTWDDACDVSLSETPEPVGQKQCHQRQGATKDNEFHRHSSVSKKQGQTCRPQQGVRGKKDNDNDGPPPGKGWMQMPPRSPSKEITRNTTSYEAKRGQMGIECGPLQSGTSGAPWIANYNPATGRGDVLGDIGGWHTGGCDDYETLFNRAARGGQGDDVEGGAPENCGAAFNNKIGKTRVGFPKVLGLPKVIKGI
ncbi:hypothetical protein E4U30_006245 [Claviceps sp. LM220 group G6]|nr:hypothetical protein E4U30_006245 [Claviceps sp. LM220 group G6]